MEGKEGGIAEGEEAKAESGRVRSRSGHVGGFPLLESTTAWTSAATVVLPPPISVVLPSNPPEIVCTLYCFSASRAIFHHPPLSRQTRLPGAVYLTPP